VVYLHSPHAKPVIRLKRLARDWKAEREDPDEVLTIVTQILAVDATAKEGPTGVTRVLIRYGEPVRQEYQDLRVVVFAPDGRARRFKE
jgi:hypothetical protein